MPEVAEEKKKFTGCSTCGTSGCNKLNVYDWLGNMQMPTDYKPFNVVEVRFKGSRKHFYRNTGNLELIIGDYVVVETGTGGHDVGMVSLTGDLVRIQLKKYFIKEDSEDIKKIYRKATEADQKRYEEAKQREAPVLQRARTLALQQGLKMKLSDVEFLGDNSKAVFFYTAEERVDFRALIKAYADEFKIRIEMRQIGYRQEASRLGGIGSCGRELCCSSWLTDFKMVSVNAARYQNLSINPLKLSGQCGKMKCCLNFELDTYAEALSEFPETNTERIKLRFESVTLRWVKTDILKRLMWFVAEARTPGDSASPVWMKFELASVKEILELNSQGTRPADPDGFVSKDAPVEKHAEETADTENIELDGDLDRFNKPRKSNHKKPGGPNNRGNNPRPPQGNPPRNQPNGKGNTPDGGAPGNRPNQPPRPPQNPPRNPANPDQNPKPPQGNPPNPRNNNNPRPPQGNPPRNNPNQGNNPRPPQGGNPPRNNPNQGNQPKPPQGNNNNRNNNPRPPQGNNPKPPQGNNPRPPQGGNPPPPSDGPKND